MLKSRLRLALSSDDGVSLVEVIIAIVLVAIISTASAGLVINGIASAATQERRQVAVTIASGIIETVNATNTSQLFTGRSQAAVSAAFAANSTKSGVSKTAATWDAVTPLASTQTIPITSTSNLSGTTYTATTLMGTCYQARSGGDCTIPAATGASALYRVIVIVRWTPGTSCASNECFYQISTLVDPHTDLEWVTSG